MTIWINAGRYYVLLPNGESFATDRFGNVVAWTYDPAEHVGRRLHLTDVREYAREAIEQRAGRQLVA